jgi:pimeloyl-ACP methyl ester carboxylesterase
MEGHMDNPRIYGQAPYVVAVLHGGPGAPGSMAPVAEELASEWGVLEPFQTALSVDGQVEELRAQLSQRATLPVTLIGSSWGAMLGFIFAARYPTLVRKLLMVGSGVFEERYAAGIEAERMRRLSEDERARVRALIAALQDPTLEDKGASFAEMGALYGRADAYDPISDDTRDLPAQLEVFERVWTDAQAMRARGELVALGTRIQCPVVALHGDYDPHPAAGIREPLAPILRDFRFISLRHCGHLPWLEREARAEFFRIVREELRTS